MNVKAAIRSLRVRTTPLVLSGVLMGVFVAMTVSSVNWPAAVFLALTAVFLQFVSNLSNELGDTLNGTDREDREGMQYSLQSGELGVKDIKVMIGGCVLLSCVFGLLMIYFSMGTLFSLTSAGFILLGALAIVAAMRYTLGKNPYGYRGLGDIFVFLFFGLAVVCGGCFLSSTDHSILSSVPPACAIGCFSVGVLNVNNIRDMKADAATRVTMAIRMGGRGARIYQTMLIILGWACMLVWSCMHADSFLDFFYVLSLPLFVGHLTIVWRFDGKALDRMVPMLSKATFMFSAMAMVGCC